MPKSYSEQEREYIRKRLKEEAAKCLARYGVRRTTVDEIVKRVNIPKGTFYLFYYCGNMELTKPPLKKSAQTTGQTLIPTGGFTIGQAILANTLREWQTGNIITS